jgi:hypothetical protein
VIHPHHVSTQEVVIYLGLIVGFELHDGSTVEGRVIAADEWNVYLARTRHKTVPLNNIKQIVNHPF